MKKRDLNQITDKLKEEAKSHLEKVTGELTPLVDVKTTIKETDFLRYLFPLLKGDLEFNEDNMERFTHNILALTNSLYVPIDVIEDNSSKHLFTLPPIMLQVGDMGSMNEISLSKVMNKFKSLQDSNSLMADDYLKESINSLKNIIKPDNESIEKYIIEFYKIYKRYNLLPKEAIIEEDDTPFEDKSMSDIFDYE